MHWRSLASEAIGRIRKFLAWWGRELMACLPAGLRKLISPERTKLLIEIHKMGTLKLSKVSAEGREPLMTVRPRADKANPEDDNSLHGLTEDVDSVVISLPESCGVRRRVDLPAAARENLREVLAMEMDRLTPFKTVDIYFAHGDAEPGRQGDQISVDLTIVPKKLADDIMKMALSLGIEPDILALGDDEKLERNLLGPMPQPSRSFPPLLAKSFGAAVALLIIAAIVIPFAKQASAVAQFEAKIAAAGASDGEAALMQKQLAAWQEGALHISDFRTKSPAAIVVLDQLSTAIPAETWLTDIDLSLRDHNLSVSGYSSNAPALIAPLEALDILKSVKFVEPVAFDERQARDRFRLTAELVPAVGAQ